MTAQMKPELTITSDFERVSPDDVATALSLPTATLHEAAGVRELLWDDIHPGEHGFADNKAHEFFGKYL